MATTEAPLATIEANERFLLPGVSWGFYKRLLKEPNNRHVFVTYDRGNLELMSPSWDHGRFGYLLGRLIQGLTEELDIPVAGGGMTTFRKKNLDRGLEPDQCFWIATELKVRGKRKIKPSKLPPPDLAIEIDITSSHLNRQGIYAALGVPEIWCFDGRELRVLLRQDDGHYAPSPTSLAFPFLPMERLSEFLLQDMAEGETRWIREFRIWVQRDLVPRFGRR